MTSRPPVESTSAAEPAAAAPVSAGPAAGEESAEAPVAARTSDKVIAIIRQLGSLSVLAAVAASLPAIGGFVLLGYRDSVAAWLHEQGPYGLPIYVVGLVLFAGLALLPTYAQAILAGYVFHMTRGAPAALLGFVGAALLGYAVARLAGGDRAMQVLRSYPRAAAIRDELVGAGFWKTLLTVTLIRLPPNSPFAMTNLVMAVTSVPLVPYIVGTLVGMAPRTVAMIYVGSQLQSLSEAGKPWWYFWAGVVITLIVLGAIGHMVNRVLARFGPAAAPAKDE